MMADPAPAKPVTPSPGFVYFSRSNKVLYNHEMIPKKDEDFKKLKLINKQKLNIHSANNNDFNDYSTPHRDFITSSSLAAASNKKSSSPPPTAKPDVDFGRPTVRRGKAGPYGLTYFGSASENDSSIKPKYSGGRVPELDESNSLFEKAEKKLNKNKTNSADASKESTSASKVSDVKESESDGASSKKKPAEDDVQSTSASDSKRPSNTKDAVPEEVSKGKYKVNKESKKESSSSSSAGDKKTESTTKDVHPKKGEKEEENKKTPLDGVEGGKEEKPKKNKEEEEEEGEDNDNDKEEEEGEDDEKEEEEEEGENDDDEEEEGEDEEESAENEEEKSEEGEEESEESKESSGDSSSEESSESSEESSEESSSQESSEESSEKEESKNSTATSASGYKSPSSPKHDIHHHKKKPITPAGTILLASGEDVFPELQNVYKSSGIQLGGTQLLFTSGKIHERIEAERSDSKTKGKGDISKDKSNSEEKKNNKKKLSSSGITPAGTFLVKDLESIPLPVAHHPHDGGYDRHHHKASHRFFSSSKASSSSNKGDNNNKPIESIGESSAVSTDGGKSSSRVTGSGTKRPFVSFTSSASSTTPSPSTTTKSGTIQNVSFGIPSRDAKRLFAATSSNSDSASASASASSSFSATIRPRTTTTTTTTSAPTTTPKSFFKTSLKLNSGRHRLTTGSVRDQQPSTTTMRPIRTTPSAAKGDKHTARAPEEAIVTTTSRTVTGFNRRRPTTAAPITTTTRRPTTTTTIRSAIVSREETNKKTKGNNNSSNNKSKAEPARVPAGTQLVDWDEIFPDVKPVVHKVMPSRMTGRSLASSSGSSTTKKPLSATSTTTASPSATASAATVASRRPFVRFNSAKSRVIPSSTTERNSA